MDQKQDYPRHVARAEFGWASKAAIATIFAGLAVVIYPAFVQHHGARTVSCLSNLKMQSVAMEMYAQDYDNLLPPAKGWMDEVYPYVKDNSMFRCPEFVQENRGSAGPVYGYAYHSRLSRVNITGLNEPAGSVLIFDSVRWARNSSDPFVSLPNPGRHANGNNIAFADGHAKWKDMPEIRELRAQMHEMKLSAFEMPAAGRPGKQLAPGGWRANHATK